MDGRQILEEVRRLVKNDQYSGYKEINKAYREICNSGQYPWLRGTNTSLSTFTVSQTDYELNLVDKKQLERLWVKGVDTVNKGWQLMEEVPPLLFEQYVSNNIKSDGSDDPGLPEYYRTASGTFASITVTPTPDQAYTVKYDYLNLPEEITETVVPKLPIAHHDVIAELAASLFLERSKDEGDVVFSNRLRARVFKNANNIRLDSSPGRLANIEKTARRWIR